MTPQRIPVAGDADAEHACRAARLLAGQQDLTREECEAVALATMELATNLVRYATGGVIVLTALDAAAERGVQVESIDLGPGIADTARALEDGFSSANSLGCGLPAVRRLMSTFALESCAAGTHIVATKWPRAR